MVRSATVVILGVIIVTCTVVLAIGAVVVAGEIAYYRTTLDLTRSDLMGQTEDLRTAVAQLGVDLGEAISRVEARIVALGEPDPDLSAEIASLRQFSESLDSLGADAEVAEPTPEPNIPIGGTQSPPPDPDA